MGGWDPAELLDLSPLPGSPGVSPLASLSLGYLRGGLLAHLRAEGAPGELGSVSLTLPRNKQAHGSEQGVSRAVGGSGCLADLGGLPGVPGCPLVSADPGDLSFLRCSAPRTLCALVGSPGRVPRGWQRHRKEAVLTCDSFLAPAHPGSVPIPSAQRGHLPRGRACRAPGEARGTGSVTDCLPPGWTGLQLVVPSALPSWRLAQGLARPKRDQTQPETLRRDLEGRCISVGSQVRALPLPCGSCVGLEGWPAPFSEDPRAVG